MTNIFSLALLADKFHITFDSAVKNAFHVHTPFGVVKFTRGPENIYYTKPNEFINQSPPESGNKQEPFKGHFPQTVADNAQFYMKQQVSRAKAAQDLLHAVRCPSMADLKNILKMNSIANCLITLDDVDITEEIYGPDVASLKGKTTRWKPVPVITNQVSIPKELVEKHQKIILCLDTIYVNKIPFMTMISKEIKYWTTNCLPLCTIQLYCKAMDKVCGRYNVLAHNTNNE